MLRVLVVEDAPIIRSSIIKSVERFDPTVIVSGEAANGVEALEWLEDYHADLCITDVKMPHMDGLELIFQLGNRYPEMVAIVVSSYDEFDYAKQSIELDAIDYILKPVDQSKLNRALSKSIEKLTASRLQHASAIFIKRLPHHRPIMNQWLEHIRTLRVETMPMLIVETLALLRDWVGEQYFLLNALSMCWLQTVIEELHDPKLSLSFDLDEGQDLGLGEDVLEKLNLRFYFSLCAVRRLEEGAHCLMRSMREVRVGQGSRLIENTKQYISEHLAEKISIQELADLASISRSTIAAMFKQETGSTINQYVVEERMRRARDMLLNTGLRSYEVANKVGYEDVIYFAQLFKKHYGFSPIEYKKRMES
ncbi:response regulator [Paenibacillus sp. PAMC21692]|uniref:response regulator n=1 Tax=Paenibacillus sp. PAMC21692 TaxID=2762320 RepID=UPI00164DA7C1|nr:response regulator [Paenibacillus sp. PAMC21692]QNK57918.1 response regulator [Paenibacillus sp. PAMC21692]